MSNNLNNRRTEAARFASNVAEATSRWAELPEDQRTDTDAIFVINMVGDTVHVTSLDGGVKSRIFAMRSLLRGLLEDGKPGAAEFLHSVLMEDLGPRMRNPNSYGTAH